MKTLKLTSLMLLSILLLNISESKAQSIADSTMAKIGQERAYYETLGKIYPPAEKVTITETSIAGVKSYWFNQSLTHQKRIIIYLHGGVYALGSINSYRAMVSHLAQELNAAVLYVEYSLAPEKPFPAANNEIFNVYKELKSKYPGYKFTIIGDSAGGGLAVTLVHNCIDENVSLPSSLALISPWIDLKTQNGSYITKQAVDPILSKKMLHEHAELYAPNRLKEADPSELKFKKFPPVSLLVGTDEVLNDDSRNFYAVIKPIQKNAKFKEYPGQKHVWLVSDIHSKESVAAINDIKEFLSAN
ncbi:alpha/beta hydrolase fold domain-containing protein [Mucilaginibacter sp. OK098]|uniref:alpha/beta hydrolase fold domain-containing protein n=1 Tax=Mucilaginibacter sp. OK098 TaxID=1855297 RepID=UPI000912CC7B|nr:alpha/beta hydrolase fold domain-containing protein [Mucilaginibacter sp. OK098]SHM71938.1 Acetyl esterase/lipase [Mucilaginibacter sp. OK098]